MRLTYTVGHTIPSPVGSGVTRTLDRTAVASGTTGPSCIYNKGSSRLEVRLTPPQQKTYSDPSSSAPFPPWDWTKHYAASNDARNVEIVITDGDTQANRNMLLNLASRNGWKFYNIDFIYGTLAVNCDNQATPPQFFGCNFLGGSPPNFNNDGNNINNTSSAVGGLFNASAPTADMVFDHCNLYGSCPPWSSWQEGKGFMGAYGLMARREHASWTRARHVFRYCSIKNWWHFTWMGESNSAKRVKCHFHHSMFRHFGVDGGLIEGCSDAANAYLVNRCFAANACLYGWSGKGGLNLLKHSSFNVEIRLTTLHTGFPGSPPWAWIASGQEVTPAHVAAGTLPHGTGARSEHSDRQFYNTLVGTQNTSGKDAAGGSSEGYGCNLGPDAKFSGNHRSFNNIAAVYPANYAWPLGKTVTVGVYLKTNGDNQCNNNVLFRQLGCWHLALAGTLLCSWSMRAL